MSCVTLNPMPQLSAGLVAFPMVPQPSMTTGNPGVILARHRLNTPALALASARGRKRLRAHSPTLNFSATTVSSLTPTASVPSTHLSTVTATATTTKSIVTPRSALASASKSTHRREKRSVRFSPEVVCAETYSPDDYDRSVQPMAQLSFRDFAEMLQVRATLRRQMEEAIRDAANGRIAKGNLPAMQALHLL